MVRCWIEAIPVYEDENGDAMHDYQYTETEELQVNTPKEIYNDLNQRYYVPYASLEKIQEWMQSDEPELYLGVSDHISSDDFDGKLDHFLIKDEFVNVPFGVLSYIRPEIPMEEFEK